MRAVKVLGHGTASGVQAGKTTERDMHNSQRTDALAKAACKTHGEWLSVWAWLDSQAAVLQAFVHRVQLMCVWPF
eukprot:5217907-Alexandrium_andersonii.AAC.1